MKIEMGESLMQSWLKQNRGIYDRNRKDGKGSNL